MKFRIRVDEADKTDKTDEIARGVELRGGIEKRIRMALGARSTSVESIDVFLTQGAAAHHNIRCQLLLRNSKVPQKFAEEDSEDLGSAVDWLVWRMVHYIDRRALRDD